MALTNFDLHNNAENPLKLLKKLDLKVITKKEHSTNSIRKLNHHLLFNINLPGLKPVQWKLKRIFDIFCVLLGSIIISPMLLVVAMAIKLDSRGPVLFKQKRVGYKGKEFYMYKFRSMKINAEEELKHLKDKNETCNIMFKLFDDPRVTRVGKFIRKYSIDELPQLINVLKGDMSLVGFRPPLTTEIEKYKDWHYLRFLSMPGLTGVWQVSGRSNIKDFNRVIEMELNYIKKWNFLLDIKLLFKTIPVVIFGKDTA